MGDALFPMPPTRRTLLRAGVMGLGWASLAGCSSDGGSAHSMGGHGASVDGMITMGDPLIAQVDAARTVSGSARKTFALTAKRTTIVLAGRKAATWAYDGTVPGPLLRGTAGDRFVVDVTNELPQETTVHWHGIRLRSDMDGVPGATQAPIAAGGGRFRYEFTTPDPGTYFFHPHVGMQLDRGLYAPLIVDDPADPGDYDSEWVVVLDDWLDGIGGASGADTAGAQVASDPDAELKRLQEHGVAMMGQGSDVQYPLYLIGGHPPADPEVFQARPGARIRIRVINASADTTYRLVLGGHRLTVTHKDGISCTPTESDAVLIAMGERYDLMTTAGDGVFPLVAACENKPGRAFALLRTGSGAAPATTVEPHELSRQILYSALLKTSVEQVIRGQDGVMGEPDLSLDVRLSIRGRKYEWLMNNETFAEAEPQLIEHGQVVRLTFANTSHAIHPMHLHGHSFRQSGGGAWHDTILVGPMAQVSVQFVADNPGVWMLHCHNIFHAEAGMMATIGYRAQ